MGPNKEEQRSIKRYSIDGLTVQAKENHFLGLFEKTSHKHMVMDISEGGVHFMSRQEFKEGDKITLTIISHTQKDFEPIIVKGRIKRVKSLPGLSTYGIGVEFINMEPANIERIRTLIQTVSKTKGDISSHINITTR